MILLILATLGVPLWLLALLVTRTVIRHNRIKSREGDIPVRAHVPGKDKWARGHAIWVHDVFVFRASPAMWSESTIWVTKATTRSVRNAEEAKKLRRIGEHPAIVVMTTAGGADVEFATTAERAVDLLGPYAVESLTRSRSAHA